MHFDLGWNFLLDAGSTSQWEHFEGNGQNISSEKYAWLEEVGRYPGLHRLVIREQIKHPRGLMFHKMIWDVPRRLGAICECAGVRLEVWLRKPIEGKSYLP